MTRHSDTCPVSYQYGFCNCGYAERRWKPDIERGLMERAPETDHERYCGHGMDGPASAITRPMTEAERRKYGLPTSKEAPHA